MKTIIQAILICFTLPLIANAECPKGTEGAVNPDFVAIVKAFSTHATVKLENSYLLSDENNLELGYLQPGDVVDVSGGVIGIVDQFDVYNVNIIDSKLNARHGLLQVSRFICARRG